MTCIAWDGKVLAGDKQSVCADIPVRSKKVFRIKVHNKIFLLGFSGDETRALHFIREFKVSGFEDYPHVKGCTILIVSRKAGYVLEEDGEISDMREKKWAVGGSGDFALGAMHAGASAREAVLIASKLSIKSGMGVDTVKF